MHQQTDLIAMQVQSHPQVAAVVENLLALAIKTYKHGNSIASCPGSNLCGGGKESLVYPLFAHVSHFPGYFGNSIFSVYVREQ